MQQTAAIPHVTTCAELPAGAMQNLLGRYAMQVVPVADDAAIPGSFWGDAEAGLVANKLYVRGDTPVHSALHEACHYICMDARRRATLDTDAGGHYDEENGVCYLQILLADFLPQMDRQRMMQDMDSWGYSFRLGSARRWFEQDAADAAAWLQQYDLIDPQHQPTWKLRT
ncbi:MAG: hypothetical protein OEZ39_11445 [Gammaproteobacteria bacterium]|nr:hypothetical protein [Gammaproteobacteria bacterium]MDH5652457.1 hypothetical protein [Gammaproteobacteria bacterium]